MIRYIVWRTDYDKENSHILGIYKTKERALKKCNFYNKTFVTSKKDILSDDDGLLGEFNSRDDICYCTRIEIENDTTEMYFMKINESNGGGSYHDVCWIHASLDLEELIDTALIYFSQEHNRDNQCSNCIDNMCKKKLIKDLKKKYFTYFDCTDYEEASIKIWTIVIFKKSR